MWRRYELESMMSLHQQTQPDTVRQPESTQTLLLRRTDSRAERLAAIFVWVAWAAMLLVAAAAVAIHGRNIPFAEDWFLVAPLTGNEPHLLEWALERNSEHLVPVPKLLLLLLLKLTGGDFRAGMMFDTALLGAVAGGMIVAARHLRGGQSRVTDAFFPIVLLHLGHWDNLLWSWQIQFVLSTALTCVLLLLVVSWREGPPTPVAAGAASTCVVLLSLSGGNGTLVAPAFALWLLWCGALRSGRERPMSGSALTRTILIGSAVLTLLILAVYLIGYQRPSWNPASPSLLAIGRTSMKFVAYGFGPAAQHAWHLLSLAALGVLLLTGIVLLLGVTSKWRSERCRGIGLVLAAGALAALAAAMGVGRAGRVEASGYMSTRYALLSVPMLCASYFIVELYASRTARKLAQGFLFLVALTLLPQNTMVGMERREWFQQGFASFQSDLQVGMPLTLVADRHYPFLLPWSRDALLGGMQLLQRACIGPFARVGDERSAGWETGCLRASATTSLGK